MINEQNDLFFLSIFATLIFISIMPIYPASSMEYAESNTRPNLNTFSHMRGYIADVIPQIQLIQSFPFGTSEMDDDYITIFKITAGSKNINNMQLRIKSDTDSQLTNVGSMFAYDDTNIIYRIHASDPKTIMGDLLTYDFR